MSFQAENHDPGIYLIVEFDWPADAEKMEQVGTKARKLHDVTQDKKWIKEIVAASGGIGGTSSSIWIFWLSNYASLDKLLKDPENEVGQAYNDFFHLMPNVTDKLREEVVFL